MNAAQKYDFPDFWVKRGLHADELNNDIKAKREHILEHWKEN